MTKIAGITIERTSRGIPRYVRIDLSKHKDLIPFLEEKGFISEPDIKLTSKMKKSIKEAENGEVKKVDFNNFWEI
ncbi:MAG: hypothetical protein H6Q18_620 [Bacteroidetes bacterium]|nr:hypothetical protein [Bacteroidota bacterium]